ncbi:MAG TPA: HEAT repeat domain-containing protein [Desulfuromonadales bacterium]|nr:HEAT repeat domain-containing protein [Desulfuromonadales bacterium]
MAFIKNQTPEPINQEERKHERDCPNLLAQLSDPNPTARRWAARDLINCPQSAVPLVERLKIEPDVSVREVILTTLTRMGDPDCVAGLVACLNSEDAALRNEALEAMKQLPDEVAPIMRTLLADPKSDVRIFAVNILESLRHPEVESWLIEVIENDQHVNVCGTSVDLLGEVGTEASRKPLERLKERFKDEPYIQFAADLALRRIYEN